MVGRLKPGVSAKQAESDAETVAQEIMRNYPAMIANLRISAMVRPLQRRHNAADPAAAADPVSGRGGCAADRLREPGRADAGASDQAAKRSRGAAGAGSESVGAVAPGDFGEPCAQPRAVECWDWLLAAVALRVGKSMLPESLPRISEIGLNWNVVGFALLLGVVTGLVCGLVPAFAALRTNVNANLKEGGRSGSEGGGHARLRSTLVVAEIAIALVLLTASCLLLRSFEKMRSVDLGYRPEHVTTASYSLPQKQYEKQSQIGYSSIANC